MLARTAPEILCHTENTAPGTVAIDKSGNAVAARLDESSYTDAKIKEKMMEYKSRYGARTELIDIPVSDLSSSMIRRAVAAGEDISSFVPGAVADYIYRNGLYR